MKLGNLKSLKPRVFKFKKGTHWDGDEEIIHYIEDVLLKWDEGQAFPIIKKDTFITIMCARKLNQKRKR